MRPAVALMLSLLLLMTAIGTALACTPVAPPPLRDSLDGATALAYGQVTTEYTSGRVILSVKAYAGPGPAPEQLAMQMIAYQPEPDCSKGPRVSVLHDEVVLVLTGNPPDLSESALSRAATFGVYDGRKLSQGDAVNDVLSLFAVDHGYTVVDRTTPAPDRKPTSDGPLWDGIPVPVYMAAAGAVLLTAGVTLYRLRLRRSRNGR